MYRKLTVLLATMLVLTCLAPASAVTTPDGHAEPDDVIGIWYLSGMEAGGESLSSYISDVEIMMELSADNTALMQAMDVYLPGTWTITDGQIMVSSDDGNDFAFTLVDGNLIAYEDEVTIVFSRDNANAEPKSDYAKGIRLNADSVNHIKAGQSAYIALSENRTTPVFWEECTVTDESVMVLVSDQYIMDDNPYDADGVGGTHWYYFKAVGSGGCTIQMLEGDVSCEPTRRLALTYDIVVEEANSDVKTVKSGQVFSISLDENQSIPYRWKPEISDGNLIKSVRDEIDSSGATSNIPGAGGEKRIFYFKALRPGACTINMNDMYMFPEDGDEVAQTESYTIIIEP